MDYEKFGELLETIQTQYILDPCFGSGTVGVVAENLNRRWICNDRII